jgi:ankyrin repeat protein
MTEHFIQMIQDGKAIADVRDQLNKLNDHNILKQELFSGDTYGNTALHLYVAKGDLKGVDLVVEYATKCDCLIEILKSKNILENTALHIALVNENPEIMDAILSPIFTGKNLQALQDVLPATNIYGKSPLHLLVEVVESDALFDGFIRLAYDASMANKVISFKEQFNGATMVHYAVYEKNEHVLNIIVKNKNLVERALLAQDISGNSPLHWVVDHDNTGILDILLTAPTDLLLKVFSLKNYDDNALISHAISKEQHHMVTALYRKILGGAGMLDIFKSDVSLLKQMLSLEPNVVNELIEHVRASSTLKSLYNLKITDDDGKEETIVTLAQKLKDKGEISDEVFSIISRNAIAIEDNSLPASMENSSDDTKIKFPEVKSSIVESQLLADTLAIPVVAAPVVIPTLAIVASTKYGGYVNGKIKNNKEGLLLAPLMAATMISSIELKYDSQFVQLALAATISIATVTHFVAPNSLLASVTVAALSAAIVSKPLIEQTQLGSYIAKHPIKVGLAVASFVVGGVPYAVGEIAFSAMIGTIAVGSSWVVSDLSYYLTGKSIAGIVATPAMTVLPWIATAFNTRAQLKNGQTVAAAKKPVGDPIAAILVKAVDDSVLGNTGATALPGLVKVLVAMVISTSSSLTAAAMTELSVKEIPNVLFGNDGRAQQIKSQFNKACETAHSLHSFFGGLDKDYKVLIPAYQRTLTETIAKHYLKIYADYHNKNESIPKEIAISACKEEYYLLWLLREKFSEVTNSILHILQIFNDGNTCEQLLKAKERGVEELAYDMFGMEADIHKPIEIWESLKKENVTIYPEYILQILDHHKSNATSIDMSGMSQAIKEGISQNICSLRSQMQKHFPEITKDNWLESMFNSTACDLGTAGDIDDNSSEN